MASSVVAAPQYLERRAPVVFPESADVPETQLHLHLRTILYQLLWDALGPSFTVGSDQFVYYDAADPKRVLAPDVYVRKAPASGWVRTWKVWERGAPEVAVEIISDSDAGEAHWRERLACYQHLGVQELVRYDPEAREHPLRVWDRVDGVLVERVVEGTRARSFVLGLDWMVAPADDMEQALRIATDGVLFETRLETREAEQQAREAEQQAREAEQQAREAEQQAREAAEARVRELEGLLQASAAAGSNGSGERGR